MDGSTDARLSCLSRPARLTDGAREGGMAVTKALQPLRQGHNAAFSKEGGRKAGVAFFPPSPISTEDNKTSSIHT